MWLLNTSTLQLHDFVGARIPEYAILSHTWGESEVSFKDMRKYRDAAEKKAGYLKVQNCCEKARSDGYNWVWIDTCCIDKRSSAELSEAINSMWKWYQESEVCYAYLVDVPSNQGPFTGAVVNETLAKSRWFTRGWTLQELIAPKNIRFFGQDWTLIGQKAPHRTIFCELQTAIDNKSFLAMISVITGIDMQVLRFPERLKRVAVAKKMFWASKRETTREEDAAYSLMGLFGVSMPILYGEGLQKAFRRLQLDIIQRTTDQSIFVWKRETNGFRLNGSGLLADSPSDFVHSNFDFCSLNPTLHPYSMTNVGLLINMPCYRREDDGEQVISLGCWMETDLKRIELRVSDLDFGIEAKGENFYRRNSTTFDMVECFTDSDADENRQKEIYVLQDEQYYEFLTNSEIALGGSNSRKIRLLGF